MDQIQRALLEADLTDLDDRIDQAFGAYVRLVDERRARLAELVNSGQLNLTDLAKIRGCTRQSVTNLIWPKGRPRAARRLGGRTASRAVQPPAEH